jgi:dTDP-4-amino-4,6-dideoxygalactose transaminase
LRARIAQIADHGRVDRYRHAVEGVNSRLDAFQAAGLRVKLKQLSASNERRARVAAAYTKAFEGLPDLSTPFVPAHSRPVWHLYSIESPHRDALMEHLKNLGIGCGVYYPIPLHLQPAYARLGLKKGAFPVSERVAERILSLPMFPEMTDAQVDEVIRGVRSFKSAVI